VPPTSVREPIAALSWVAFKSATNDAVTDNRLRDSNGSRRSHRPGVLMLRYVFLSLRERPGRRDLFLRRVLLSLRETPDRTVLPTLPNRPSLRNLSRSERNTFKTAARVANHFMPGLPKE
jgi:hypothetical protein